MWNQSFLFFDDNSSIGNNNIGDNGIKKKNCVLLNSIQSDQITSFSFRIRK